MEYKNHDGNDPKIQIFVKPKRRSGKDDNDNEQILIYQPNIGLTSDVRDPVVKILN